MCSIRVEPRIETERLVLTPAAGAYVDRLIPLINDVDIARMTTRIPHPYGLAEADEFRRRLVATDIHADRLLQIETHDGELIGAAGAHRGEGMFPEIGYWIARHRWGQGFATEAAEAVCRWAVRAFGVRGLIAGHFADNAASGQVLIKCGFLYTGEVQQRFSLARGEDAATRMMVWLA